ncbi:unnamed protein product [Durusdinium trenchii]|uniref:Uncharacterized protein n=1 Tax=Durusdinium trenchii TaxID=1381693 RepID=A0ABP0IAL4_9DINO
MSTTAEESAIDAALESAIDAALDGMELDAEEDADQVDLSGVSAANQEQPPAATSEVNPEASPTVVETSLPNADTLGPMDAIPIGIYLAIGHWLPPALAAGALSLLLTVDFLFACEIEKFKQRMLVDHVLDRDTCLFEDLTKMTSQTERKCVRHQRACDLPQDLFGFVSGFSCKSLSKLQNDASLKKAMSNKNQDSTSYRTFKGNLDVLNYSRPMWVALENVDVGDCSDDDSNGAVISKLLKETGYHTRMVLLEACQFGLPQRRVRLFILGVHIERAQAELMSSPENILNELVTIYLPAMKLSCPSVDFFLRPHDDDDIVDELHRRQDKFPATIISALAIGFLCCLQFPTEQDDQDIGEIEALLNRCLV